MRKTKWEKIAAVVQDSIDRGDLKPGDRVPSERDLVEKWKVARMTAHKAMHDLQSRGLIVRTRGQGSVVSGGQPMKTSGHIALVFKYGNSAAEGQYLEAIQQALNGDRRLLMCLTGEKPQDEARHLEQMAQDACAIILNATCDPENTALIQRIADSGKPIVCIENAPDDLCADKVVSDNRGDTVSAMRFLFDQGHRRVAHLNELRLNMPVVRERYEGYLDAMASISQEDPRPLARLFVSPPNWDYLRQTVYDAMCAMLRLPEPPTAVFCLSAAYILALLDVCSELGISVPGEMEIVGYCERPPWAIGSAAYKVTRIVQPMHEMGTAAAARILSRLAGDTGPCEVTRLNSSLLPAEPSFRTALSDILVSGALI